MNPCLRSVTVPSKTFVFGEYAVLEGAPALVFASKPSFKIFYQEGEKLLFHPESPAGRYLAGQGLVPVLENMAMSDPHQGQGGFGGSTAEFLAAFASVKGHWQNLEEVWQAYRDCCRNAKGVMPSGADLVAQVSGGFSLFQASPFLSESMEWPYKDLELLFVRTGAKVKTHEHLEGLASDFSGLKHLSESLVLSFKNRDMSEFCLKLDAYQKELERLHLVAESTQEILKKLRGQPGLRVAKGCGAMGADVVMLIFDRGLMNTMKGLVDSMGLYSVATLEDQSMGASIEWLSEGPEVSHVV